MANEIKSKFSASTALTITLASLASSTAGVGRQSTKVNNETDKWQLLHLYFKVTTGTSPTANKSIQFYLIRYDDDTANIATDNAGATDAALTVSTADQVYAVATSATSDVTYRGSFTVANPGQAWAIAVVHDTAVNLNATAGNHEIRYVGENPEVQ